MIITTHYLYDNIIDVIILDSVSTPNRNFIVYARDLKIYKGVDNVLKFQFKNTDQKIVDVEGKTIVFRLIDTKTRTLVLTKTLIQLGGDTSTITDNENKLILEVSDLHDIQSGGYTYSLVIQDDLQPAYVDDSYNAVGVINIYDGMLPVHVPTRNISIANNVTTPVQVSSTVVANEGVHTAQFNFNNFTGRIKVFGTLDGISGNSTTWAEIDELAYLNQTATDYHTWFGIFSFVKFEIVPTTGTVTKILYRP
jgi:hypothetical protein